jgi:hypothetical protein
MHDSLDDFPPIHRKKNREVRRGLLTASEVVPFRTRVTNSLGKLKQASKLTEQMANATPVLGFALNWYFLGRTVASCFSEILLDME